MSKKRAMAVIGIITVVTALLFFWLYRAGPGSQPARLKRVTIAKEPPASRRAAVTTAPGQATASRQPQPRVPLLTVEKQPGGASGTAGSPKGSSKSAGAIRRPGAKAAQERSRARIPLARVSTSRPTIGSEERPDFVLSLARDLRGNIWIGCESEGVFRYTPSSGVWTRFTASDGLGDDSAYALNCDRRGRMWVGHLNHGVSVYSGSEWKNYDVVAGPIGERVFAIETCPTDGDVWIATDAGLTRYSDKLDHWSHYTRADGLPSNQAAALAFDAAGNVYVGFQYAGIAWAEVASGYKHWHRVTAATAPGKTAGQGLPSDLLNDLLIARDGAIYAATTAGLARSTDHGHSWTYSRGLDCADKLRNRDPSLGEAAHDTAPAALREDYVTTLAQDDAGNLMLGYRQRGWEAVRPGEWDRPRRSSQGRVQREFITALLPLDAGRVITARYGGGVSGLDDARVGRQDSPSAPSAALPDLPTPSSPPKLAQLIEMARQVAAAPAVATAENEPLVAVLDDDWRTGGAWVGRYGRYWTCLAAMTDRGDYIWGAGPEKIDYAARIGPHCTPGDQIRYWVHWLYTTNPKSLEMPPIYFESRLAQGLTSEDGNRRQAEWDDHGETYPIHHEGPDLYVSLRVPSGMFYLSLYDFNKDGHSGNNRLRDYLVSVRQHRNESLADVSGFAGQAELARARIHQFYGGVYKRFLVQGPSQLTVRVARSYSHNTILSAVMLDLVDELPPPYFVSLPSPRASQDADAQGEAHTCQMLLEALDSARVSNPRWWSSERHRFYAPLANWFLAAGNTPQPDPNALSKALGTCYYHLGLFEDWEACQKAANFTTVREIELSQRWDGKSSYSGLGHQTITRALTQQPPSGDGEPLTR